MAKFPKNEIENLLKRINKYNDAEAFNRLVDLKSVNLQKLAYTYLLDEMHAEDVVSEVFCELTKKRGQFKDYKNLNGWMNVATINKSLNLIKKKSREILKGNLQKRENCCTNRITEQIHIKNCMAKLDEDERQAISYQYYGYSLKEISEKMRLTINKTRGLLGRAKEKFKNFYEK